MADMLWLNGALRANAEARIAPDDRGLLLGDGLFETCAAQNGTIPDLPRHFIRLCHGAEILRIPVPISLAELAHACHGLLAANTLRTAAVRITLTRGSAPRGLLPPAAQTPTLLITASPMPGSGPLRLITATIRRDALSPLSRLKTLNYLPGILARMEAAAQDADDALLLNHQNLVAETTTANLFVKRGGQWLTPPVADGALPGIRRAKLLDSGRVTEASLTPAQLHQAAAIFAGNAISLRPVITLDGHPIPQTGPAALS
jgi:branched-chain amino acid aminotransferase